MIFEDIKAKARWLYGSDSPKFIARACLSDATLSMVLYRSMAWFNARIWGKPLAFICHKLNAILCGCVIGINAKFGRRFVILHSVGVVVNSAMVAGDDVVLESGVVIGAEKGLTPKIGSRLFVGSGAKIVGGLVIGDDVTIGANGVVIKDLPDNVVAVGVPVKIINKADRVSTK